jgi:hypothetical protein
MEGALGGHEKSAAILIRDINLGFWVTPDQVLIQKEQREFPMGFNESHRDTVA